MNVTTRWLATSGAYCLLFLLGAVEGIIGSFQYSRGPAPVAALCFCAAILATCVLAGRGMRSVTGALMPAAGWIVASLVLSMPVSNGSVIIANTSSGKWFLYGGTLSVLLGVAASLALRLRSPR